MVQARAANRTPSKLGTWMAACALVLALTGCRFDDKPSSTAASTAPPTTPIAAPSTPPPANTVPTISGSPATSATVGAAYSFQPVAADAEGDKLTFAIVNKPAWATFDSATGRLAGTPSSSSTGVFANILISVSDGPTMASLAAFAITVSATNTAPRISGTPATSVTVGQAYAFTPTASDAEGQALTFSISSKPAWATFSTTTGKLSGTPSSSYVGTFPNIVIAVSDGQYKTSLPTFAIEVKAAPTVGSATLSWVAPKTNVDGTPVTNLAGFRIAYGQNSSNLTQSVNIASPTITSASIENLSSGTWYFAVKAYTTTGVESDLSNLASKTI